MAFHQVNPTPVTLFQVITHEGANADKPIEKFKVMDNDKPRTVNIPMCNNSEVCDFLLHIWSYRNKTSDMEFGTFESQHKLFVKTLYSLLKAEWTAAVDKAQPGVPNDIEETFVRFISKVAIGQHGLQKSLLDYIAHIKKSHPASHREIKVMTFFRDMQGLNRLVPYLPGGDVPLSATKLKVAFFDAMPNAWRDNWLQNNYGVEYSSAVVTIESLITYFTQQESISAKANSYGVTKTKTKL